MTWSDDDAGETSRRWKEVPVERDDAALEDFLLRVHELGQGSAPAPNARLADLLGVSAPVGVRRIAPRTVAGATALGLVALFGTGWAAAAADQLPGPAQRTVARLTAGWLPGIPHPEDQRTGAATTPASDLPTPTTTTGPAPAETGDGDKQPVRQPVAPPDPTGSRDDDGAGAAAQEGREPWESQGPRPASEGTGTEADRDDDAPGGTDTGAQDTSGAGSTAGTDDGGTDPDADGEVTGSDGDQDGSVTGSTGEGADH